jgi:hypothetical protein
MGLDPVTYASPNPPLPAFLGLIQNATTAQALVKTRALGAVAARNAAVDVLYQGIETQAAYVQGLANATPSRAVTLIENAGFLVAKSSARSKPMLALTAGKQPGIVYADACLKLLLAASGTSKPHQHRFFTWQTTLDGGKTFVNAPPTGGVKTTFQGLPSLAMVGVRVSMIIGGVAGEWSQVVSILVP